MADLVSGAHIGLPNGPLAGAEGLTSEQLEELERIRPSLQRLQTEAYERVLATGTMNSQEAVRAREWVQTARRFRGSAFHHIEPQEQGRERRPACNQRRRGSRRSSSRASPDDPSEADSDALSPLLREMGK